MAFLVTPEVRTWVPGTAITANILNSEVRDALRFLISGCACSVALTNNQSTASGSAIDITWDTLIEDVDGIISIPGSEFIFQRSGVIAVRFTGTFGGSTSGHTRNFRLQVNDGTGYVVVGGASDGPSSVAAQQIGGCVSLNIPVLAGYKIKMSAFQDSGGSLALLGGLTKASLNWVGKTLDDSVYDVAPVPDPAPSPTPVPVAKHSVTYNATWSNTYNGDGSKYSALLDCAQGQYSSNHGNQTSLIGFDSATIVSDLSGATITSMALTYNVVQTFYPGIGSTLQIGGHHYSSSPSTWDATVGQIQTNLVKVQVKQGKLYTQGLPLDFAAKIQSGQFKGINLGPGPGTAPYYYARITGASYPNKPKLNVTYWK